MELLKNKATLALVIMILGVSYIGALDNNSLEDNTKGSEQAIVVNA